MTLNLIAREFVGFERAFARQLAAYRVEQPQAELRFDYLDVPPLYTRMVEQRGALDGQHDLFLAVTDWLPLLKVAAISLTRSLAAAYAKNGVRVNCVCPGLVDTEMWKQIDREVGVGQLGKQPGEYWQERIATIPLGRAEQPEDVAHLVGFLASSKADYMTGQAINVTGGLIMH